jgi:hypothetical protein
MIAHQLFRLSLAEATRRHKRSEFFRHPLFGVAEVEDPLEPAAPFVFQSLVPLIEAEWNFSRDAVPDYIRLSTGREARKRSLAKLVEEYSLPVAARFRRVETSIQAENYNPHDSSTWLMNGLFCSIQVPREISGQGIPVFWCGCRSTALVTPMVRAWFFDPRTTVTHGAEAVELGRQALSKVGGR